MDFRYEDLPQYGLLLLPPAAAEYGPMVEDIRRRTERTPPGFANVPEEFRRRIMGEISEKDKEWSAVLVNRSAKAVALMRVEWRFEEMNGRAYKHSYQMGGGKALLTPFGMREEERKVLSYWNTILPGSKRYLGGGKMVGDNTDVRPAAPGEVWKGGAIGGSAFGRSSRAGPMKQVTLALDGVFFLDGEFVGPNESKLWEEVVYDAEERARIARMARQGHDRGLTAAQILTDIESVTGPAPEPAGGTRGMSIMRARQNPELYRRVALENVASTVVMLRKYRGDEGAVYKLLEWADTKLPEFRRR